jgi:pimeloyl-ACP methyl ester carboxylesterase
MADIFYRERGEGNPLIFIHGFPMHQAVWDDFGERFTNVYTVITLDLPGFGKSPVLPYSFSLDQVAEQILNHLAEKEIRDSVVIGHSLGGYVGLSMIQKRPDLFSGIGLFHSTAYADSTEKKESREKVLEFVAKNGAPAFTTNFIAPLFANPQHPGIETVKKIAVQSSGAAVVGYTMAMRDRQDQTKTLKNFKKPTLFLGGDKDPGIPPETISRQAANCQHPEIHILRDVAHMGMFEKPAEAAAKIKGFLNKI